ncbi:MAG: L-threonylcarbamoyladenylate synthase [Hyphomicrobium sp.]
MPNSGQSKSKDNAAVVQAADPAAIEQAGRLLRDGALVAFPTETVYGLGADATNGQAVARIFEAKGRPHFNPLIVHAHDAQAAACYGVFNESAQSLAEAFWPGPLTLVVARRDGSPISELATGGLNTVALRVPDHPIAQAVLRAADRPLAAPSANRSGHVSATRADHVAADLGARIAMIIDGGGTRHGVESTIVALAGDQPRLLRLGAVTVDAIEAVVGERLLRGTDATETPQSPGQLASHYAPRADLRLDATHVRPGEARLMFGSEAPANGERSFNLSESGDLVEAAANLFAALRILDATGVKCIAVSPIPQVGLGEAINDRLRRAAAPRS